eukprot:g2563.t1
MYLPHLHEGDGASECDNTVEEAAQAARPVSTGCSSATWSAAAADARLVHGNCACLACAVATPGRIGVLEGLWQQRKQIEADIAAEDGAQKRKKIGVRKPEANRTGTGYRERPMAVGSSVSVSIAAATAPAAAAGAKRKRSPPAAAMDSWLVSAFTTVVVSWGVHIAMFIHHFALNRWALYRRKVGPDDECVVDVCGSRSTTAFVAENGREAAGALTLGAVRERMAECCCTQANAPSLKQLAAVWRAYAACATRREQDRVIGRDDARLFAKLYDSSITALRRRPCGECAAELYTYDSRSARSGGKSVMCASVTRSTGRTSTRNACAYEI